MKKIILFSFFLLTFTAGFSFAEKSSASVNMDYLSKAKREKYVEDFSYVPRRNYNTGKQIRDMGRRLGAEVRYQAEENKTDYPFSSGYPDYKYKASRVYSSGSKSGADVVYIGRRARVGTFKNLNRVISGYIERAYGISMADADQIALKVCYWNTNHYNDASYFKKNFDPRVSEVFRNRTKSIGLSRSYKDWQPARVVIPFTIVKEIVPEVKEPLKPVEEKPAEVAEPVEEKPVVETPEPVEVQPEPAYEAPVSKTRSQNMSEQAQEEESFFQKHKTLLVCGIIGLLLLLIILFAIVRGSRRD
ncbi:MAG: hypothetical protein IKS40_07575 [Treponema sp.]|nr:hypothetical protein [Treponema sp.]